LQKVEFRTGVSSPKVAFVRFGTVCLDRLVDRKSFSRGAGLRMPVELCERIDPQQRMQQSGWRRDQIFSDRAEGH
jgi:hypothetical protein